MCLQGGDATLASYMLMATSIISVALFVFLKADCNLTWSHGCLLVLFTELATATLFYIPYVLGTKGAEIYWIVLQSLSLFACLVITALKKIYPNKLQALPEWWVIAGCFTDLYVVFCLFQQISQHQIEYERTRFTLPFSTSLISALYTFIMVFEFSTRQCQRSNDMLTIPEIVILTVPPYLFTVAANHLTTPSLSSWCQI